MRADLKSLAYAFVANDVNVYFPDGENDSFIIEKLVCAKCDTFWHTSFMECYFCGELNYYLYQCTNCNTKYSITNSSKNCSSCGKKKTLIKACINENCPTNQNMQLKTLNQKEKGVFDLKSSLNLSLMYCINCGSNQNQYKTFKIFVYNDEFETSFDNFLKRIETRINTKDLLIFKKHNGTLKYTFQKVENLNNLLLPKNYLFQDISDLIENILKS